MPPRTRYTPTRILEAALNRVRTSGIDAVSARSLASDLGCSTAPLFTHFASMDDLHEHLMDRIIEQFVGLAAGTTHSDPLISAGRGWLRFAAEEPRLYEALFLRHHVWHAKWGPVRRQLARRMADHPRYADLDEGARFALVGRAAIVLHGLGVEIWSGRLVQSDEAELLDLIQQLVLPVVQAAIAHDWTTDLHARMAGVPSHSRSSS